MTKYLLFIVAIFVGAAVPIQAAVNANLKLALSSSTVVVSLISFLCGTLILLVATSVVPGSLRSLSLVGQQPIWMLSGGFLGAIFLFGMTFLASRIGLASLLSLVIAGQLVTSLTIDHFGLLGLEEQRISIEKILGVALIVIGVSFVNFKL